MDIRNLVNIFKDKKLIFVSLYKGEKEMDEVVRNKLNEMCPAAREAGLGDRVIDSSETIIDAIWNSDYGAVLANITVELSHIDGVFYAIPLSESSKAGADKIPMGLLLTTTGAFEKGKEVRVRVLTCGGISNVPKATGGTYSEGSYLQTEIANRALASDGNADIIFAIALEDMVTEGTQYKALLISPTLRGSLAPVVVP